ncbi:MAG: hypothetical protein QM813_03995 [Verrucomicrobiota bacterium]
MINLILFFGAMAWFIFTIVHAAKTNASASLLGLIPAALLEVVAIIFLTGHFTLQPNEARVLILFGTTRAQSARAVSGGRTLFTPAAEARCRFRPGQFPPKN